MNFQGIFGPFWQKVQKSLILAMNLQGFGGVFRFRKSRLGVMVFQHFRESKTMSIAQVTVVHLMGHFALFH